jgi:hypothetical protein
LRFQREAQANLVLLSIPHARYRSSMRNRRLAETLLEADSTSQRRQRRVLEVAKRKLNDSGQIRDAVGDVHELAGEDSRCVTLHCARPDAFLLEQQIEFMKALHCLPGHDHVFAILSTPYQRMRRGSRSCSDSPRQPSTQSRKSNCERCFEEPGCAKSGDSDYLAPSRKRCSLSRSISSSGSSSHSRPVDHALTYCGR